jgi:ABC-type transport system substrate-binding protein
MKLLTKKNILLVFLATLTVFPLISVVALAAVPQSAQAERVSFVIGSGGNPGGAQLDDWDPTIVTTSSFWALETLVWGNWKDRQVYPGLAESWTLHARANESGNTGGVAAISFNLRQGVEFMDGSKFNASVVKWNYDRMYNITGQDIAPNNRRTSVHWFNPSGMASRFTPNWNLSWAAADPFNLGGNIPFINETIIVSEYVVNFTLNKWVTSMFYFTEGAMISSKEYAAFATKPIRGYAGSGVEHLVGTGPYQFVYADFVVTSTQYSVKNENYWNKDFLEAQGLFVVDDLYTRWYATAEARSTALLAGDIDSSGWQAQSVLTDMGALDDSAYHTLYPTEYDASYTTIQFSNRENNDVPLAYLYAIASPNAGDTLREYWPTWAADPLNEVPPGGQLAQGVNKSVRQAISWAFDYDSYMNVQYAEVGAIRTDNPLGTECVWNDHTVPDYEYDITKARQVLLSDPYYATLATARGLDINSADSAWTGVGLGLNPINTFTYLDGGTPHKVNTIGKALNDLGFGINVTLTTSLDTEWMYSKKAMMFDMFSYIWPTGKLEPFAWMGVGMKLLYSKWAVAIPSPSFNFATLQNDTVNYLMDEIPWAGTAAQPLYNELSAILLEEAGHLYIAHAGRGSVVNSGWNVTDEALERGGGMDVAVHWLGGARSSAAPPAPPEIPGYSTLMVVLFSIVSVLGLSYSIAKKRRKH